MHPYYICCMTTGPSTVRPQRGRECRRFGAWNRLSAPSRMLPGASTDGVSSAPVGSERRCGVDRLPGRSCQAPCIPQPDCRERDGHAAVLVRRGAVAALLRNVNRGMCPTQDSRITMSPAPIGTPHRKPSDTPVPTAPATQRPEAPTSAARRASPAFPITTARLGVVRVSPAADGTCRVPLDHGR